MIISKEINLKLNISGSFECLDKDGNVLKVITINGSIPLENLIMDKDINNGIDNCE